MTTTIDSKKVKRFQFELGEKLSALNIKYKDGTRLRESPSETSEFNGVWVANDTPVIVEEIDNNNGFILIKKENDGQKGWIRERNLTREFRKSGITKGIISNEMVTPDPEYVRGMKIYNCGIKEDPAGKGSKFGKGVQHLISSHWLNAMSEFVASHLSAIRAFISHAQLLSKKEPGFDFVYFTNMSSTLLNRADILGLKSQQAIDYFLMATFLIMAAAEVDTFPFSKYTLIQRQLQRESFYSVFLSSNVKMEGEMYDGDVNLLFLSDDTVKLGKFAAPLSRRDLLPPIAIERLGINNELSALKYEDPEQPLREGFRISNRMDSLKRHFEGVHRKLYDEDHIIHALWNFHAIFHVITVFPQKNDLIDYSAVVPTRSTPIKGYIPATSLEKINKLSLPLEATLKLDWNEGCISPPSAVLSALIQFINTGEGALLKWYPHLNGGTALIQELTSYCNDSVPENILVTNGSDDALILICQAFLGHGKTALVQSPTYEHFCTNVMATGAELVKIINRKTTFSPFSRDPESILQSIEETKPNVVYIVSPNNPTGVEYPSTTIEQFAILFPNTLFLIDEAYHEFASIDPKTEKPMTCASVARQYRNVIVTRTFSKAFCLASVRCGYIIAHPTTIEELRVYYNPKSVNEFAQVAAFYALKSFEAYYQPYISATNASRELFIRTLIENGIEAQSGGGGNFVCIHVKKELKVSDVCKYLEDKSIFVRDISARFPEYFRVSIGLEMSRVVKEIIQAFRSLEII